MSMDRRTFLTSAAAVGAAPLVSTIAFAGNDIKGDRVLGVVDNSLPESSHLIREREDIKGLIEVKPLSADAWKELQALQLQGVDRIVAYTRWADYIVLRDVLREKGLKLQGREQRIDLASGEALFAWQMA